MTDERDMDDREGLAAEYVLGTLPQADRAEAERLIARDPGFAALVTRWERHFEGMNDAFDEARPPPGVLERTEARLFPAAQPRTSPLRFWLGGLAGVALATLVAFLLLPPLQPPSPVVATLTAENQPLVVAASYDPAAAQLTVSRAAGPAAAAGQDYQFWIIPPGQAPVPMGLVREGELVIPLPSLPPGTTLAVSLEAEGGSTTGQPSETILVTAVVAEA